MYTAQQDKTKTGEVGGLPGAQRSPGDEGEFWSLQQTRATLAENEQWLVNNADKILPASQYEIVPDREYDRNKRDVLVNEEDCILRCLGAAVMTRWSTLPAKVQRELLDHAASLGEFDQDRSIGAPEQTVRLKALIARFFHSHNGQPIE
jgi:hypothetical protein